MSDTAAKTNRPEKNKTVFSPCDILLPPYEPKSEKWERWAVIACDQHTSDVSYWDNVKEMVKDEPSTLELILPEAYLGSKEEETQKQRIKRAMKTLDSGWLSRYNNSFVYVERKLSNGKTRRGIVGKIDLEEYDYSKKTASAVRPTEGTVAERIPPRMEIRREAALEAPHVMVFVNDEKDRITEFLSERKGEMRALYDFELMLGGGHITGYLVEGELQKELLEKISALEKYGRENGVLVYGVGDGNHSLATAKACYEELKKTDSTAPATSKARYAAVELVSVYDDAVVFEPIYRLVKGVEPRKFISEAEKLSENVSENRTENRTENTKGAALKKVTCVSKAGDVEINIPVKEGGLTVGAIQDFIDSMSAKENGIICDYIHDESTLRALASEDDTVGLLFSGMEKSELFPYVSAIGALPRKTFSMGDASSKRYYLELRKIK